MQLCLQCMCLRCFDAVGWTTGRASGLWKTEWWGVGMVICLERGAHCCIVLIFLLTEKLKLVVRHPVEQWLLTGFCFFIVFEIVHRTNCYTWLTFRPTVYAYMHTHTHPFNGPLSRITWLSRYQKGKISLDFTEARDSEWQWHQLGRMQVCTSLQTDNMPSPHHSVFTGHIPFLPPNQQHQSTEGLYAMCK